MQVEIRGVEEGKGTVVKIKETGQKGKGSGRG